ncbi:shikimate dehydrogenase [Paenibacillus sp. IITD108]|uniref:shikimate dehydrogenase n=1 Tax=Paenibacillus sp. IITD108 TaxID=3116649 RepID=UPI002F3EAE10
MARESFQHVIDSHTTLFGVIGDPIRHSKSPVMMNRAFCETGVNGVYTAFHITDQTLPAFIAGVRAMNIRGVNVTIPHKLQVMGLLDHIDEGAAAIGAVNTIVNDNGILTGYNTDGIGYVRSLKEEAIASLTGKRIVVIGAGGAARGIIYALLQEQPAQITVVNRTVDKAEQLAAALGVYAKNGAAVLDARSTDSLQALCGEAELVINTTSVGMFPNVDASPLDASWLQPGAVASDLIYNPLQTKFLLDAKQRGCITHGGLGMFINQGAYAFEYWTGKPAPVAAMREIVLASLEA